MPPAKPTGRAGEGGAWGNRPFPPCERAERAASVLSQRFVCDIERGWRGSRRRTWSRCRGVGWRFPVLGPGGDVCFECFDAGVGTALQFLRAQLGEPALDEVEPGAALGDEVELETGVAKQPAPDRGRLVGGVVVEDQVHGERRWHGLIEQVEELAELDRSMASMQLMGHPSGGDVESCEQAGGAVAEVVSRVAGGRECRARSGASAGSGQAPGSTTQLNQANC